MKQRFIAVIEVGEDTWPQTGRCVVRGVALEVEEREDNMIDIIIRDCGHGEWLPIIVETATGRELSRGERESSREEALESAKASWDDSLTGNIIEFKEANGL